MERLAKQQQQQHFTSLMHLRSIANHCHNLQGLNLAGICVERVEDHIRLWEILSHMKLTHTALH